MYWRHPRNRIANEHFSSYQWTILFFVDIFFCARLAQFFLLWYDEYWWGRGRESDQRTLHKRAVSVSSMYRAQNGKLNQIVIKEYATWNRTTPSSTLTLDTMVDRRHISINQFFTFFLRTAAQRCAVEIIRGIRWAKFIALYGISLHFAFAGAHISFMK